MVYGQVIRVLLYGPPIRASKKGAGKTRPLSPEAFLCQKLKPIPTDVTW